MVSGELVSFERKAWVVRQLKVGVLKHDLFIFSGRAGATRSSECTYFRQRSAADLLQLPSAVNPSRSATVSRGVITLYVC